MGHGDGAIRAGSEFRTLLMGYFRPCLPKPVVKNIVEVVNALLTLAACCRGWYGRLTLWGIARAMAVNATVKARRKRIGRFISNKRFDVDAAFRGLLSFSGIQYWDGLLPVLLDQTSFCKDAVEAIVASFVNNNRGIPFDMCTFDSKSITGSQNAIEGDFIKRLIQRLCAVARPIFVMDRGYAKVVLLKQMVDAVVLFVVRGCRNVIVEYGDKDGVHRTALGRLPCRQGKMVRYHKVKYRDDGIVVVDIIVYRGRGFEEPWFLIVPAGSEEQLPTERVVQWYRSRMRIEATFRDFKACMGMRKGMHLLNDQPVRMARILVCLSIAYMVLIALGCCAHGRRTRKNLEVRRRTSRHGTTRTLSVLTVAILTIEQLLRLSTQPLCDLFDQLFRNWTRGLFSPELDAVLL